VTASRCGGFSPSRRASTASFGGTRLTLARG
jgi:hypothetical protein